MIKCITQKIFDILCKYKIKTEILFIPLTFVSLTQHATNLCEV